MHGDSLVGDQQYFERVIYKFNVVKVHITFQQSASVYCLHGMYNNSHTVGLGGQSAELCGLRETGHSLLPYEESRDTQSVERNSIYYTYIKLQSTSINF